MIRSVSPTSNDRIATCDPRSVVATTAARTFERPGRFVRLTSAQPAIGQPGSICWSTPGNRLDALKGDRYADIR